MKWPNIFTFCHMKQQEKLWIWESAEQTRGPGAAARLLCVATARNQIGITGSNQMTEKAKNEA